MGGIETLMEVQRAVLTDLGHQVIIVSGRGGDIEIPAMHPENVSTAARLLVAGPPETCVAALAADLQVAVRGCTHVWVHNILTVALNLPLTRAGRQIILANPQIHWVYWCADVSAASRFVNLPAEERAIVTARDPVRYVAISQSRRDDLAAALALDPRGIRVITPPVNPYTWLELGAETRTLVHHLDLFNRTPLVLVPSKLLPHKNLSAAARLARGLGPGALVLVTGAPSPHERSSTLPIREVLRDAGVALVTDVLNLVPSQRTVRELMLLADLVFLPSHEEGFGMPVLEAAALRVPLLCSDILALRESAGPDVCYVQPDAEEGVLAREARAIASYTVNVQRRRSIHSLGRFRAALEGLLQA